MSKVVEFFTGRKAIQKVLITLLLLGLIQSLFTNIGMDEAYYWFFSKNLDWGYFDHPPLVALIIAMGSSILPGTIGVRLMTVLLSIGMYALMWDMIPKGIREKKHSPFIFLMLILGIPVLGIYSFITTTDVPLLFFTALYLNVFQRFIKESNVKWALLLAIAMAGLIYSKYHGLMVILITLASRPRLMLNPYYYLAGAAGILFYLPHLWWQYHHDFISFNYHLSYRNVSFRWTYVLGYLVNTVLVLSPFIFPIFISGFKRFKGQGYHHRALTFLIFGIFAFFGFTSVRGHVEPHWVAVTTIPIAVYLTSYLSSDEKLFKYFKIFGGISVAIMLLARVTIMLPLPIKSEFHSHDKSFFEAIKKKADGRNVLFTNSYTEASRYSFYTGDPSFSYNFVSFRKNQYDLWDAHSKFHGKDAMLVTFAHLTRFDSLEIPGDERIFFKYYDNIPIINNVFIEILEYPTVVNSSDSVNITFSVYNPYPEDLSGDEDDYPWLFRVFFFDLEKERVKGSKIYLENEAFFPAGETVVCKGKFGINVPSASYTIGPSILPGNIFPLSSGIRTKPIEVK